MKVELIARIAHEANRVFQIEYGDPAVSPTWDQSPEWQKESAIEGVKHALNGAGPEELHESWCRQKEATGWVYGEVKDGEKKTHPCLVSYDKLPERQRDKDVLFKTIVESLSSLDFGR